MTARPGVRLALAWLTGFVGLIDGSIISLALPDVGRDLDRGVADLAWLVTGFLIALVATLLAAGRLADRFGQRVVLAGGAVVFAAATLVSGLAPTYEVLLGARLVQGAAGGVLYTVSLAIAATAFPPERRATALSIYFTSGALGAVIGPAVGGLLTELGGWRVVFLAQVPGLVALAVLAAFVLPAATGRPRSFDAPGIAAASVFLVAANVALLEAPRSGWTSAVVLGATLVAVVAAVAFVLRERVAGEPAIPLRLFGRGPFVVASLAGAAAWFGITSASVYPALYLQLGRGVSPVEAGLILLAGPLVALVLFPFGGRIVAALGPGRGMLPGLIVLVASSMAMVSWGGVTPLPFVAVVLALSGAGIAITLVASATGALAGFPPEEVGTASAIFNSIRQLGAALGVALPAVAYELVAEGSRESGAALDGSVAAFLARTAALAVPLAVVAVDLARRRSRQVGLAGA